jgi:hypothetical protein
MKLTRAMIGICVSAIGVARDLGRFFLELLSPVSAE